MATRIKVKAIRMLVIDFHFATSDMTAGPDYSHWTRPQLFHGYGKAGGLKAGEAQGQSPRFPPVVDCALAPHLSPPAGTSGTRAASCSWASKSRRVSTWAKRSALAAGRILPNFLK